MDKINESLLTDQEEAVRFQLMHKHSKLVSKLGNKLDEFVMDLSIDNVPILAHKYGLLHMDAEIEAAKKEFDKLPSNWEELKFWK